MFPLVSQAVEIPKTEEEALERYVSNHPLVDLFIPQKEVFLEIIRAESGFNPQAVNWNCLYGKKSMSCKKEDRDNAWSVDCSLAQINYKGKSCPKYLMDIDINIAQAVNLYLQRGFQPWNASKKTWKLSLSG